MSISYKKNEVIKALFVSFKEITYINQKTTKIDKLLFTEYFLQPMYQCS
jgi:hypothetical protein